MWSCHKNYANDARISTEEENVLQLSNRVRVPLQLARRDPEDTPPNPVTAGADQGVRDHATHTVSNHDDSFGGGVMTLRVKRMDSSRQTIPQGRRVYQYRGSARVIELPDLVL